MVLATVLVWFNTALPVIITFAMVSANWLRLGRRDKAVWNALLGLMILVLLQFENYSMAIVQGYDISWGLWSYQIAVVIVALSTFWLVYSTWRNTRHFEAGESVRTGPNWRMTLGIGLGLFLVFIGLMAGLNVAVPLAGYARFPTIYDLAENYTDANARDLDSGLFQSADLSGKWQWFAQTNDKAPYAAAAAALKLENPSVNIRLWRSGFGACDWDYSVCTINIDQYIRRQSTAVTQTDIDPLAGEADMSVPSFNIELAPVAGAVFQTVHCSTQDGKLNSCYIVLGFKHVITTLAFISDGSPKFIAQVMNQMVPKVVQRIIRYEAASN